MAHPYHIINTSELFTPALVFFPAMIRKNIQTIIAMAGGPDRVRPHVKTHKTKEIARLQLDAGVTKHKCATIAEAEMLAMAGAPDVMISYPLVGPNVGRFVVLCRKYPATKFSTIADDRLSVETFAKTVDSAGLKIEVLADVNVGQNRTGVELDKLYDFYRFLSNQPGIVPGGLHCYDGHNSMESHADREAAVRAKLEPVLEIRKRLEFEGLPVPRVVCGGTPTFPIYAAIRDVPGLECSPGTYVLHDYGYGLKYADLAQVVPAAVLITRVISKPTANRVTLDLGTKAVASDPPAGKRVTLLDFPAHTPVGHNEEHYIVETDFADQYKPGDVVYAIPSHICPTVALHREALIAEDGKIVGAWQIAARDRKLTC